MIKTRRLSNGLRMVMEEMPAVKSIAIGIWVKTGSCDEEAKYGGISHFVEHMMFKGTNTRDAKAIASDMEKIGAQMNAFTGKEATCYYFKSVSDNYHEAADIIIDMLENSLFEKKELDRERMVVCEEIKMGEDSPDDVAHDALIEQIFKGTELANSVIGTATNLNRITHNVMSAYVREQYVRESIVVSAAGCFDADEICEYFEKKLLSLGEKKPERKHIILPYEKGYRTAKKDIQQSHLCIGTKAVSLADENTYAYQILCNILGGGMSSRLFQNIREEKGLAYTVYSNFGTFAEDGYFEIYAGVAHDKIHKAIEGIREEIEFLAKNPVTEEEIASSKQQLISSYVYSQENTSTRMVLNGKNYLLIGKAFDYDEVFEGYNSVDVEKIEEIKKAICDFDTYSASVASNKSVKLKEMMQ